MQTEVSQSKVVRVGAWAALIAGAALLVKVAHIFAVDGASNPIQPALYLGAVVLGIAGAAGVGALYGSTRAKKIAIGFAVFFGFIFFLMMLSDVVGALIEAVVDDPEYVAEEVPVALAGLAWLVVGYKLRGSTRSSLRSSH